MSRNLYVAAALCVGLVAFLSACSEGPLEPTDAALDPLEATTPDRARADHPCRSVLVNARIRAPRGCAAPTLQAAIDRVATGETVRVLPGSYSGATISKGLVLEAIGNGPVLVGPTKIMTTEPVVIRGITFQGGDWGLFAGYPWGERARVTVEGSVFRDHREASIGVFRSDSGPRSRVVVRDSRVEAGALYFANIYVHGPVDFRLENSAIRGEPPHGGRHCVVLRDGAHAVLAGNHIEYCHTAVLVRLGSTVDILGNRFVGPGANAVRLFSGDGRIERNTFTGYWTWDGAIEVRSGAHPTIRFNDIDSFYGLNSHRVDATCNWWGSDIGPFGTGLDGANMFRGNPVVTPWATAPIAGSDRTTCDGGTAAG